MSVAAAAAPAKRSRFPFSVAAGLRLIASAVAVGLHAQLWMQQKLQEGTTDMAEVYGDPTMEMSAHKVLLEETFIKSGFISGVVQVQCWAI